LSNVNPKGDIARTEIFGPVLSLMHVDSIDEAIQLVNGGQYGNMACLFTSSGAAARKFRSEVDAGNVGINIGVLPRWPSSHSAVGKTAFLARCTARVITPWNFSPIPKWW
jgi:acyl-CoA reductase-like NAD-dependent aldehyde dehydrogenase